MADIRIEKEKSTSILPWILGLLLLALIAWGVIEAFDEAEEEVVYTEEIDEVDTPVVERAAEIDDAYLADFTPFFTYTEDMTGEMGLDHEFSHRALTLLATATASVADSRDVDNVDARSKSMRVKQLADEITKDPYATDHADKIRMAALLITEVLEDVDARSYNGANSAGLEKLRMQAQDINAKTLTLNQKEDVRSFFGTARSVLDGMR